MCIIAYLNNHHSTIPEWLCYSQFDTVETREYRYPDNVPNPYKSIRKNMLSKFYNNLSLTANKKVSALSNNKVDAII